METTTPEQCASAYAITDYYHTDVINAIKGMIDETSDQTELDIVSGLLRGSLRHLLDEAQSEWRPAHDNDSPTPPAPLHRLPQALVLP